MKLVWLRNDLRVIDNPALYHACLEGRGEGVAAVAVIVPNQWRLQDEAPARVQFWLASLQQLQADLQRLNIPLKVLRVASNRELPSPLLALALRLGASGLYFNREYPAYEQQRDEAVAGLFRAHKLAVHGYHGDLVLPPGAVLNRQGEPFKVFTPFGKVWRRQFMELGTPPLPAPPAPVALPLAGDAVPHQISYDGGAGPSWSEALWPAGAEAAHRRLERFVTQKARDYGEQRDFPTLAATSALSPYLAVGAISARQCLAALQLASEDPAWLDSPWVGELIWREFFRHLLVHYPALSRWQPFKPEVEQRIRWQPDPALFDAWCRGETGFALVDASMKQLLATGWMHNRLRMVTASFLTKLLRQDWRQGARFFMRHLIDGDFASNLGGWQWSASTGADAAPYFRIFNPALQAERFDPAGAYVARWLPELAGLSRARQQDPRIACEHGRPAPIIDYRRARAESLADFNNRGDRAP